MENQNELPVIALQGLEGKAVPTLNPIQEALAPYVAEIAIACWFIWFMTAFFVLRYIWRTGIRTQSALPENDLYSAKDDAVQN